MSEKFVTYEEYGNLLEITKLQQQMIDNLEKQVHLLFVAIEQVANNAPRTANKTIAKAKAEAEEWKTDLKAIASGHCTICGAGPREASECEQPDCNFIED